MHENSVSNMKDPYSVPFTFIEISSSSGTSNTDVSGIELGSFNGVSTVNDKHQLTIKYTYQTGEPTLNNEWLNVDDTRDKRRREMEEKSEVERLRYLDREMSYRQIKQLPRKKEKLRSDKRRRR